MTTENHHERTELLRRALVVGNERDYETDVAFHTCIDGLAGMLPPMLDGLAAAARAETAALKARHIEMTSFKIHPDNPTKGRP